MHYLALTFSTLLSSQASGAHRAGNLWPGLGQLDLLYEAHQPASNRSLTSPTEHKTPSMRLLGTERAAHRLSLVGQWVPSGSAAVFDSVPHPVKALTTLRVGDRPVKPASGYR